MAEIYKHMHKTPVHGVKVYKNANGLTNDPLHVPVLIWSENLTVRFELHHFSCRFIFSIVSLQFLLSDVGIVFFYQFRLTIFYSPSVSFPRIHFSISLLRIGNYILSDKMWWDAFRRLNGQLFRKIKWIIFKHFGILLFGEGPI